MRFTWCSFLSREQWIPQTSGTVPSTCFSSPSPPAGLPTWGPPPPTTGSFSPAGLPQTHSTSGLPGRCFDQLLTSMALAGEGLEAMEEDFSSVSPRLLSFTVLYHSPTHLEGHTPPPSPRSAALPPAKAEGRLAGMLVLPWG